MTRYGYLDMSEGYTDIGDYHVRAICHICGRRQYALREECWEGKTGNPYTEFFTDDACTEYDEGMDTRQHEW